MNTTISRPPITRKLLIAADFAGVFFFAASGAIAAINGQLDLLGLMVLAFATALGGGIIRDLLIGAVPPLSIKDWRSGATAFVSGAIVFFLHRVIQSTPGWLMIGVDAAGLSLFAIAGAAKALDFGIHPFMAVLMGMITAVGGGVIRDVLLMQVPLFLRTDIYAVAAMAGAAVMIIGLKSRLAPSLASLLGASVCFTFRIVSVWQHWNLPKISRP